MACINATPASGINRVKQESLNQSKSRCKTANVERETSVWASVHFTDKMVTFLNDKRIEEKRGDAGSP